MRPPERLSGSVGGKAVVYTRRLLQAAIALTRTARAPQLDPRKPAQFVDPPPVPRVAVSSGTRSRNGEALPYYRNEMGRIATKLHRDLPATSMWGFGGSGPRPTIEARTGEGVFVEWVNALPPRHFLPIDHTLHGAEVDKPEVRTVVRSRGEDTARKRWLAGGLVHARQIGHVFLSKSSGSGGSLVSRSRHGN